MKVVATQQGYYGHVLRNRGDVFHIRNDGDYSAMWMRPAKGETAKPVPPKKPKSVAKLEEEAAERIAKAGSNPNGDGSPARREPEREDLDAPGEGDGTPPAGEVEENEPEKGKGTGSRSVL